MSEFSLYKNEKLCSRTAIDRLFESGSSIMAYPLRAVYVVADRPATSPAQFLITIPKKKVRKAVDRVLMRRRIREAYRLNRALLRPALEANGTTVDIAFIYLSPELKHYEGIEKRMRKILTAIAEKIEKKDTPTAE